MSEDTKQSTPTPPQMDPAFFTCVNEYLELTNKQAKQHGLKRISMASLYAAARFNSHVYLSAAGANAGAERAEFLEYMTHLYRRMLNEHLDNFGAEREMDVGASELEDEYLAAGLSPTGRALPPAGDKSE